MSRRIDSVVDIDDSKETWRLSVRILDVWTVVNSKGRQHLEMVVIDSKGDRIQVLIRNDHTPKWKQLLKEDMTCIINNGSVYENDFQWKLCDHPKKFVFLSGTTVKPIDLPDIPANKFFFKGFADILAGNCKVDRLEDIIGVVQEINNYQTNAAGKKVVVSLKLRDLGGNVINCSLWDNYGSKFLSYYNDEKNTGAIVMVLTHSMIKDCQVSNGWSGSKLMINENIPVIQEMLSKIPESEKNDKPSQSTQSLSNWSAGTQFTPVERFVYNAKCMLLADFWKLKQEIVCVTVATTLKFSVSKYGWFYYGCTKCSLKCPYPSNSYKCGCGEEVKEPIPRYKVEIYVRDGDTKYRFVFWDNDCASIMGKTTYDMRKSMLEFGEDDPMVYPDELEVLLNKRMTFRVKVQPNYSQGSVQKLDTNESFINQISNVYISPENHCKLASPDVVADQTIDASNPELTKVANSEDNVDLSAQSLSAMGENEPDFNSALTPIKEKSSVSKDIDVDCNIPGATQYSGIKPTKKVKTEPKS